MNKRFCLTIILAILLLATTTAQAAPSAGLRFTDFTDDFVSIRWDAPDGLTGGGCNFQLWDLRQNTWKIVTVSGVWFEGSIYMWYFDDFRGSDWKVTSLVCSGYVYGSIPYSATSNSTKWLFHVHIPMIQSKRGRIPVPVNPYP